MNKYIGLLQTVMDPELRESIVDLGLIYDVVKKSETEAEVVMTLTTPYCPMSAEIQQNVENTLKEKTKFEKVTIKLVWEPAWDPSTMASDEIKDKLGLW